MNHFLKVIIFSVAIAITIYLFIISVDPYDKYNINFWNLETKAVKSIRKNRFYTLENAKERYNMFILGSSRVNRFDPQIAQKYFGYKTFNYGVFNAMPEDYLAILNHILSKQSPKVIILHTDFYMLNKNIPIDKRLVNSPLADYIDKKVVSNIKESSFYLLDKNYMTLDALIDSIITLYKNVIISLNKDSDTSHKTNKQKRINPILIKELFDFEYKDYQFDEKRIGYLKRISKICRDNNIELIVSISPVSKEHLKKIIQDKRLYEKFIAYKKILVDIFHTIYDFNNISTFDFDNSYWQDSIHPTKKLADIILKEIFLHKVGKSNSMFGFKINSNNIDMYLNYLNNNVKSINHFNK